MSHRRGPWSQQEDAFLQTLVREQGALNWVRISQALGSRTPKQCRERYHQNLKPSLNHEPISPEEGEKIEMMVGQIGKRWAEIARRLNGRSDNAVKNWWNGNQNRRRRSDRRRSQHPQGLCDDGRYPQSSAIYHHQHSLSIHPHLDPFGRQTLPSPTSPAYLPHCYGSYHSESSVPSPSSTAGASPRSDAIDVDASGHSDSASSYTTSFQSLQLAPLRCDAQPRSLPGVDALLGGERRESGPNSTYWPPPAHSTPPHLPTAPSSPLNVLPGHTQNSTTRHTPNSSVQGKAKRMDIGKMLE